MVINTTVNGKAVKLEALPDENLADVLKKADFSVRQGCDTTNCGLCTIWFNGKPMLSCSIPAFRAEGAELTTIDGLEAKRKWWLPNSSPTKAPISAAIAVRSDHDGDRLEKLTDPSDEAINEIPQGESLPLHRLPGAAAGS